MAFRHTCLISVLALSLFSLLACGPSRDAVHPPVNVASQTDDGELRAYLEGMVEDAINNQESAAFRSRLAMAYDANSFVDAAITTYEQASQLDPSDMRWPYLASLLYSSQGQLREALAMVEAAIERDGSYLPSFLAKGYWLLDLGEYQEACATFEYAASEFSEDKNIVPLTLGIAQCQLELDLVDLAVQTIALLPEGELTPYARTVKGRVLRASGQQAIEGAGEDINDSALDEVSWADPIAGAVVEYTRGFSGESLLAQELIENGRASDALPLIDSLRDRYPDEPSLVELRGAALIELGQRLEARTVFEEGTRLFPLEHTLHFNIGLLNEADGRKDEALSNFNRAIELEESFVAAYDAKASLLVRAEETALARETLEASLQFRSQDPRTLYLIGILFGRDGQWEDSVKYLSQVIDLQPKNVEAHASLALSLSELGRFEDALKVVKQAQLIAPDNAKLQRAVETLIANGVLTLD